MKISDSTIKYCLAAFAVAAVALTSRAADLTFSIADGKVYTVTPSKSEGLEHIYVIENTLGVTASYRASSAESSVKWSRFGNAGAAYAEEINFSRNGAETTVALTAGDSGYVVEEGGRSYCFWITDYANHRLELTGLEVTDDTDCDNIALTAAGSGDAIIYYTMNGVRKELSRELKLTYHTLVYDESSETYSMSTVEDELADIASRIRVTAPLCDTQFTLSGDRFESNWGDEQSVSTGTYNTHAVAAETTATQVERDNDNEATSDVSGLGGSAPVEITFNATVSDAVVFTEWQMSTMPDFDVIDIRVPQTEFTYVFRDYGTTYVRFMASNSAGSCDTYSQTYDVNVGESKLLCPNAFSPGASEGVNDEWKVSYKSIVEFECHIFNRWGVKMAELTDPSQGWDGRHGGKVVPSGVYYYVIKARGSDGRKYDLSGDINVINYKQKALPSVGQ